MTFFMYQIKSAKKFDMNTNIREPLKMYGRNILIRRSRWYFYTKFFFPDEFLKFSNSFRLFLPRFKANKAISRRKANANCTFPNEPCPRTRSSSNWAGEAFFTTFFGDVINLDNSLIGFAVLCGTVDKSNILKRIYLKIMGLESWSKIEWMNYLGLEREREIW